MLGALEQASPRPAGARFWTKVGTIGATIPIITGVITGGWKIYEDVLVAPTPAEMRAEQVISEFKKSPYADARAAVAQLPTEVMVELQPTAPSSCGPDRSTWAQECHEARAAFESRLLQKIWDSSESRRQFTLVVTYYRDAIRCASAGECDRRAVETFFEDDIQMFWRQTWPYARAAASYDEYAKWLLDHCDGDENNAA